MNIMVIGVNNVSFGNLVRSLLAKQSAHEFSIALATKIDGANHLYGVHKKDVFTMKVTGSLKFCLDVSREPVRRYNRHYG